MELIQVSKSTWAVIDGSTFGNVGCIRIPKHIAVIDTGMTPEIAKEFHTRIQQEIGTPITEVILTHYHSDHVFGAQEFQRYPLIASLKMAKLYPDLLKAHWSPKAIAEMQRTYATTDPTLSQQLENLRIISPTRTFLDTLYLGDNHEIEIRHTGGHTAGHSVIHFIPERILFAGDLVFCQQYPYAGDSTNNPQAWIQVLEEILEMDIETIVPGHGPLCNKAEIRLHLAYFKALEQWICNKIKLGATHTEVQQDKETGPTPPYQLKAERRLEATIQRWYNFYSELIN
ncbi:MAG: MBL fold metallo-hydrolase [Promethearchaeota archaeon]